MANLAKINKVKAGPHTEGQKYSPNMKDFTPRFGPDTNVSGENEDKGKPKHGQIGGEGEEAGEEGEEEVENQTNKGTVGDVDAEDSEEEDDDELFDGQESQEMAEQMSERVKANAIENAQRTASDARKNAAAFHKKAKYTIGDLICVILAAISDIIEFFGAIFFGLGVLVGALISFVVSVLLFIIRIFKGHSVNRALIRTTLLWLGGALGIVIPVYTIIMIIQIHNDVKRAKRGKEEQDKIAKQAEETIKYLQKI